MTITLTREEAQQVLDAMQQVHGDYHMMPGRVGPQEAFARMRSAIKTFRARLAQPEPEPVANVVIREGLPCLVSDRDIKPEDKRLYLHPQQREWQSAAIRVGEELSSVGPDGYYDMTPQQWLDWALDQQPRGKNSLPSPSQREWRSLTSAERKVLWLAASGPSEFGEMLDAKLREKNA